MTISTSISVCVSIYLALVLRGLDILTIRETIEAKLIELTYLNVKNCAIVKDNYTGVSRGFAFVEYNSIHVRMPTLSIRFRFIQISILFRNRS